MQAILITIVFIGADPRTTDKHPAPEFTVTASDFSKEFAADMDKANKKYQDKVIDISGIVNSCWPNTPYKGSRVYFTRENIKMPVVSCNLKNVVPPEDLAIGQKVVIRGVIDNRGGPYLQNCDLISKGPTTALRVTAEELAKAGSIDEHKKFYEKYEPKTLILTGVIAAIKTDRLDAKRKNVELKGYGKFTVVCHFSNEADVQKVVESYKPGDKIEFVCSSVNRDEKQITIFMCLPTNWK